MRTNVTNQLLLASHNYMLTKAFIAIRSSTIAATTTSNQQITAWLALRVFQCQPAAKASENRGFLSQQKIQLHQVYVYMYIYKCKCNAMQVQSARAIGNNRHDFPAPGIVTNEAGDSFEHECGYV